MRFRKNRAESAPPPEAQPAMASQTAGTGPSVAPVATVTPTPTATAVDAAANSPATTVTVTVERDKPQSKVQVVIRDERSDLRQHRDLPDTHSTDREFFQKFHRGKTDLKYDFWVRKRFPFWPPVR